MTLTSAAPMNPATAKPAPMAMGDMELGAGVGAGVTTDFPATCERYGVTQRCLDKEKKK